MDLDRIEAADDRTSVEELALLISEWSEEHYCAGWMLECEHELWVMVAHDDPRDRGAGTVPAKVITRMRDLSHEIGGWVAWLEDVDPLASGPVFVPMSEWIQRHAAWRDQFGGGLGRGR